MDFNTSDYFAYKKNKIQMGAENQKKPLSKLNFIFQLFLATFIIMFIVIVVSIMKYSSKMDIEYSKGDLSLHNVEASNSVSGYTTQIDDEQRKIDKRLILIQQEENAPSEAKIITKDHTNVEVIDPVHIEKNKKIEKIHKQQNIELDEKEQNRLSSILEEVKTHSKKESNETVVEKNVIIMSKVLVGRFPSFDEAQKFQTTIKAKDPTLSPFVRKVGDVFSVQMGSYQDFQVAKNQAQKLKSSGYDVWIYQQ